MPPKYQGMQMTAENFERMQRIDAITCEELHPEKSVSVTGPDGTLTLQYNTSTLVRIAKTKGMWLQPPHFREPMREDLRNEILRKEFGGRNINLNNDSGNDDEDGSVVAGTGAHDHRRAANNNNNAIPQYDANGRILYYVEPDDDDFAWGVNAAMNLQGQIIRDDDAAAVRRRAANGNNNNNRHADIIRHADFIERHITNAVELSKHDLYLCPSCFSAALKENIRLVEERWERKHRQPPQNASSVERLASKFSKSVASDRESFLMIQHKICPLDVISNAGEEKYTRFIFYDARVWKAHVKKNHGDVSDESVAEYKVRSYILGFLAAYNTIVEARKEFNKTKQTTAQYWSVEMRYNATRYNELVRTIERVNLNPVKKAQSINSVCYENVDDHYDVYDDEGNVINEYDTKHNGKKKKREDNADDVNESDDGSEQDNDEESDDSDEDDDALEEDIANYYKKKYGGGKKDKKKKNKHEKLSSSEKKQMKEKEKAKKEAAKRNGDEYDSDDDFLAPEDGDSSSSAESDNDKGTTTDDSESSSDSDDSTASASSPSSSSSSSSGEGNKFLSHSSKQKGQSTSFSVAGANRFANMVVENELTGHVTYRPRGSQRTLHEFMRRRGDSSSSSDSTLASSSSSSSLANQRIVDLTGTRRAPNSMTAFENEAQQRASMKLGLQFDSGRSSLRNPTGFGITSGVLSQQDQELVRKEKLRQDREKEKLAKKNQKEAAEKARKMMLDDDEEALLCVTTQDSASSRKNAKNNLSNNLHSDDKKSHKKVTMLLDDDDDNDGAVAHNRNEINLLDDSDDMKSETDDNENTEIENDDNDDDDQDEEDDDMVDGEQKMPSLFSKFGADLGVNKKQKHQDSATTGKTNNNIATTTRVKKEDAKKGLLLSSASSKKINDRTAAKKSKKEKKPPPPQKKTKKNTKSGKRRQRQDSDSDDDDDSGDSDFFDDDEDDSSSSSESSSSSNRRKSKKKKQTKKDKAAAKKTKQNQKEVPKKTKEGPKPPPSPPRSRMLLDDD